MWARTSPTSCGSSACWAAISRYRRFHRYPNGHTLWTSAADEGEPGAPAFGHADEVFNVIDTRQAYLQNVVVAGLRALGFEEQAARSIHFSYEVVALSPRCAAEMGYTLSEEEARKPYVEVSGRKGLGVKADDLLDRLEAAARAEVDSRHAEAPEAERARHRARHRHRRAALLPAEVHAHRHHRFRFPRRAQLRGRDRARIASMPWCARATFSAKRPSSSRIFASDSLMRRPTRAAAAGLLKSARRRRSLGIGAAGRIAGCAGGVRRSARKSRRSSPSTPSSWRRRSIFSTTVTTSSPKPIAAKKTFLLRLSRLVERQLVAALDLLGIEAPEKM